VPSRWASIQEISQNAAEASEVAIRAVSAAETTTATVNRLGESSMEEQTATTSEMSRSVQEAAGGSGQIADNIGSVSIAVDTTPQALSSFPRRLPVR
jgi:methyl-accepting chemotaxis protein